MTEKFENYELIRSPQIDKIALSIVVVQAEMDVAGYDANNPYHHNKYATLAAHWDAARMVLARNEVSFLQFPIGNGAEFGIMNLLLHTSGQYLGATCLVKPVKSAPQELMSLFTYLRRNSMSGVLSIMSGEDDDGNAATFGAKYNPTENDLRAFGEDAKDNFYDKGKNPFFAFSHLKEKYDWLTMGHVSDLWKSIEANGGE